MPFEEMIFIVSWLALAILGGGLIVAVWEGLRRRDDDVNRP